MNTARSESHPWLVRQRRCGEQDDLSSAAFRVATPAQRMQIRMGMNDEALSIAQHEIKFAQFGHPIHQRPDGFHDGMRGRPFGRLGMRCGDGVEQYAEGMFRIGLSQRPKPLDRKFGALPQPFQHAVVREHPGTTIPFPFEWMRVRGSASDPLRIGLADVADDHGALEVVFGDERQTPTFGGGHRLLEDPRGAAFEKSDAPTIGMRTQIAAPGPEQGQRMVHIGRLARAHREQLAHGQIPLISQEFPKVSPQSSARRFDY